MSGREVFSVMYYILPAMETFRHDSRCLETCTGIIPLLSYNTKHHEIQEIFYHLGFEVLTTVVMKSYLLGYNAG
jgi:hypothetical protein